MRAESQGTRMRARAARPPLPAMQGTAKAHTLASRKTMWASWPAALRAFIEARASFVLDQDPVRTAQSEARCLRSKIDQISRPRVGTQAKEYGRGRVRPPTARGAAGGGTRAAGGASAALGHGIDDEGLDARADARAVVEVRAARDVDADQVALAVLRHPDRAARVAVVRVCAPRRTGRWPRAPPRLAGAARLRECERARV